MKYLFAFVALALFAWQADATCRRVIRHHGAQVAAVEYAVVPLYSVTFQGPAQQKDDQLQKLEEQLKALQAQIEALKKPEAPKKEAVKGDLKAPDFVGFFKAKCASCHDKAVAETKGGKFVLTVGNSITPSLTEKQARRMASRTYLGTMPPGKDKLTDEEVGMVMIFVDSLK